MRAPLDRRRALGRRAPARVANSPPPAPVAPRALRRHARPPALLPLTPVPALRAEAAGVDPWVAVGGKDMHLGSTRELPHAGIERVMLLEVPRLQDLAPAQDAHTPNVRRRADWSGESTNMPYISVRARAHAARAPHRAPRPGPARLPARPPRPASSVRVRGGASH